MTAPPLGPARRALLAKQRKHPPIGGTDRIAALLELIAPYTAEVVRDLHETGHLVAGEVGKKNVVAQLEALGDDWLIEISSGLVQYLYAIVRMLHEPPNAEADDPRAALATLLVAEMRAFATGGPKRGPKLRELDAGRIASAEHVTTNADLFILSRELGKVAIAASGATAQSDEEIAKALDTLAAAVLFNAAVAEGQNLMVAYTGAVSAVWATSLLEAFDHPLPGLAPIVDRIEALQTALYMTIGEKKGPWIALMSQGAVIYDVFESVDQILADEPVAPKNFAQGTASLLFDALFAAARGQADDKQLRRRVDEILRGALPDGLEEAGRLLQESLADERIMAKGLIVAMREACARLGEELPEPGRRVFLPSP